MSGGFSGGKTRVKDFTPAEFTSQRGLVSGALQSRVQGDVPGLDGPFVAPLTDQENAALSAFNQNAFGARGIGQAADAQLAATLQGAGNPFLQQAIDASIRPILQNAQLKELQDRAAFTGAGQKIQGSSAFAEDRANALRDTQQQITDVASRLAFQERQNQLAAVELTNSRLASQRDNIATLALPRLIEQFGIDKANEELVRRFQVIEQSLQFLGQLSAPTLGSKSWNVGVSAGFLGGGNPGSSEQDGGQVSPSLVGGSGD